MHRFKTLLEAIKKNNGDVITYNPFFRNHITTSRCKYRDDITYRYNEPTNHLFYMNKISDIMVTVSETKSIKTFILCSSYNSSVEVVYSNINSDTNIIYDGVLYEVNNFEELLIIPEIAIYIYNLYNNIKELLICQKKYVFDYIQINNERYD